MRSRFKRDRIFEHGELGSIADDLQVRRSKFLMSTVAAATNRYASVMFF